MDEEIEKPRLPKSARFTASVIDGSARRVNDGLYSLSFYLTKHYNSIKTKLKRLLVTWMLVTLVGFSYILSGKEVGVPLEKSLAAMLLAIFSSRIVLLFLYLESKIYHRNLNAAFITNLKMEKQGISASRIHVNMMKSLLPEGDPELELMYAKLSTKSNLLFKRFLCWITKKSGDPSKGIDPLFYDCAPYFGICFVLWSLAGYFFSLYIETTGWIFLKDFPLNRLIKVLAPIISMLCCIYVVRRSLLSGFQRFRKVEKKKKI